MIEFQFEGESYDEYSVCERKLLAMILKTLQNIDSQLAYTSGATTLDDIREGVRRCELKF